MRLTMINMNNCLIRHVIQLHFFIVYIFVHIFLHMYAYCITLYCAILCYITLKYCVTCNYLYEVQQPGAFILFLNTNYTSLEIFPEKATWSQGLHCVHYKLICYPFSNKVVR